MTSDWSARYNYIWTNAAGQARLESIAQPRLQYEPSPDLQMMNTGRLLMGQDVLCISATGSGKTALVHMYSMARPDTITIVISPTNALESDMVC